MFDLITGKAVHTPRAPLVPMLVSTVAHTVVVGLVIVVPWLYVTDQLPEVSTLMAFVTAPPAPPSPPPPPPAPALASARPPEVVPTLTPRAVAPVEEPLQVVPEMAVADAGEEGIDEVEGGMPGGIVGGIPGGFESEIPPPPAPRKPIRIGGQLEQPTLVYRVNPVYPGVAISAGIEGMVILEAIVDEEGRVESLKVLRSGGVLDRPALEAVRQWRYSPVLLNGRPEKFILTVVVSFRLEDAKR
jgi:protein TonB